MSGMTRKFFPSSSYTSSSFPSFSLYSLMSQQRTSLFTTNALAVCNSNSPLHRMASKRPVSGIYSCQLSPLCLNRVVATRSSQSLPFRLQGSSTHSVPLISSINKEVLPRQYSLLAQVSAATSALQALVPQAWSSSSSQSLLKEPITKVTTKAAAHHVLKVLYSHPEIFWACDTEVADIDVKTQGPVGNGKVTCISIYGGPEVDFGLGEGRGSVLWVENIGEEAAGLLQELKGWLEDPAYKKVWHNYGFDRHVMKNEGIDCRGFAGDTMHMARLWDTSLDKMEGAGGYGLAALSSMLLGDKPSTSGSKYVNSVPSDEYRGVAGSEEALGEEEDGGAGKVSMLNLFGVAKMTKSGQPSKVKELPSVWELQTNPLHRDKWIQYSAKDAVCTYGIHKKLTEFLKNMTWEVEAVAGGTIKPIKQGDMYTFYEKYLLKFGELLTDMEQAGIKVDVSGHLLQAEHTARLDRDRMQRLFFDWVGRYVQDSEYLNTASAEFSTLDKESASVEDLNKYAKWTAVQIKDELRARGIKATGKKVELLECLLRDDANLSTPHLKAKEASASKSSGSRDESASASGSSSNSSVSSASGIPLMKAYEIMSLGDLEDICASRGIMSSPDRRVRYRGLTSGAEKKSLLLQLLWADMSGGASVISSSSSVVETKHVDHAAQLPTSSSDQSKTDSGDRDHISANEKLRTEKLAAEIVEIAQLKMPKRHREFKIQSFGMRPTDFTPAGVPKISNSVLKTLSGKDVLSENEKEVVYGSAYDHFSGGDEGRDACRAIGALAHISQIDTMISSFLVPLQALADKDGRIHCSLNLNTETGRLSSRKPNLQNQPALEKDQYKIRDAFVAEKGNTLLVADYGQLELRVMAHMTQCRSMLDAFTSGGCFHSRTAVGMYPYIQDAISRGEVLLEWDYSKGKPPKPLVKDVYGSERRKAKTLNFSIAYGKTVHGLAKDWGISIKEAEETLEAWYRDRPEVRKWQEQTRAMAKAKGYVRTIMGRRRNLKDANSSGKAGGHALRAAINTPIQGSAADVVMMAMIHLWKSEELKRIGWKLLLQIHDEVILEGPVEFKDQAMTEVMRCMQNPFDGFGLMPLSVKLEVDAKCADTWYKAK